ncbi:hypothetical protein [Xenorhabdus ishibashii]|uniref:Uncharacterized protein n=1 Tax=Xenorhabdus ishibashii TaxID=1034471 RepID=A0A2D0K8J9_9GAMM|nr:hypothetical protein [Xenorhabdus ishibashii]PHM59537.1 hypothetical protein Xish_03656 [Xenorhabdus ishibashii]
MNCTGTDFYAQSDANGAQRDADNARRTADQAYMSASYTNDEIKKLEEIVTTLENKIRG